MTDDNKRQAADAEQKRIEQAETDRKAREQAEADRRKAARDAPLVPNAEGNVMVEAIMGPYRGQRLTMTAADGQSAINNHWARNPVEAEYQHDALDEPERVAAFDASHAWAKAQWDAAQDVEETPPPEGGEGTPVARKRNVTPEPAGGYVTKAAPAPAPKT
jgi:hypothetical protein